MTSDRITHESPSLLEMVRQPSARNYLFIGAAALLVYYTLMAERGGQLGALLTVIIAVPGLLARWVISPCLVLVLTSYLLFDPNFERLVPAFDGARRSLSYGRVSMAVGLSDILLAAAILIYLIAQCRIFSLVHQSMPNDPPPRRRDSRSHSSRHGQRPYSGIVRSASCLPSRL